jgi:hypothetical protein
MSRNGLVLAHNVGCVIQFVLMGSPGALQNILGRGLTSPENIGVNLVIPITSF